MANNENWDEIIKDFIHDQNSFYFDRMAGALEVIGTVLRDCEVNQTKTYTLCCMIAPSLFSEKMTENRLNELVYELIKKVYEEEN